VSPDYVVRPKADRDLEAQAYYYAINGSEELGHRFLVAAHETFRLLASRPHLGWLPKLKNSKLESVRVFRVSGFEKILIIYRVDQPIDILRVVHGSRNIQAMLRGRNL
jgi:toxin ParE1/3/4